MKTQISEAIKIISYYLNITSFISFSIFTNSTKKMLNEQKCSIGPYLKIIRNCYYALVLREEKKKHKYTTHITLWKRILSNKRNISNVMISVNMLIFKIQGIVLELTMMRISYKLTKRTTNWKKREILKILKKFCILHLKTIRYKPTASGKIIHSIVIYKLLRQVSILWLPDIKRMIKNRQKQQIKKNEREICRSP